MRTWSLTKQPAPLHAALAPIDVVIVAGQSNAQGSMVDSAALSAANRHYADSPDPRALLGYRLRYLSDAKDNIGSMGGMGTQGSGFMNVDGFGPELSLGSDLAVGGNRPFAVIKYAIASAGLNQNFKKTGPTGQALYPAMLAHIQQMQADLRAQGYAPRLRALFWLQGETDTVASSDANAYGANINQLMADLRADTASPDLQFYFTQLNPNMSFLAAQPGTATVNGAMQSAAQADPTRVFFVRTDDITGGFADGTLHYTANQEITIGQKWAARYLQRNP